MTAEAKHLLEEFGALPDPSKREVLAEILRLSRDLDFPEMTEEDLASAANDVFLGYDQREADE